MGSNIKFSKKDDVKDLWEKYDAWITDSEFILNECPENKIAIKFVTPYNQYFTYKKEISKLNEINEPWLNFSENNTTLISMESQQNVEQTEQ